MLLLLPVNTLWTIAQLTLAGYSLDQNTLSGISIALGLTADAAIVIAGLAEQKVSCQEFYQSVRALFGTITASAVTTILVLVPLFFFDSIVPGIRAVVVTVALMVCNSVILSYIFFPCFAYNKNNNFFVIPQKLLGKIQRVYTRFAYRSCKFSLRHSNFCCVLYASLFICTFVIFFISGKNISLDVQDAVIFAVIEYEPEKSAEVIDTEITDLVSNMLHENGVRFIRAESRKGSAELEIGFDEKKVSRLELANTISSYEQTLPDGFLYVPESGSKNKKKTQEIEIAVTGDDSKICRDIAQNTVSRIAQTGNAAQVVLNFKNPEKTVLFIPDRDILERNSISVETIASTLRWMMFGPVVDKWIQNEEEETDIRVAGRNLQRVTRERIANLYIPTQNGQVRLQSLGTLEDAGGSGKIYRRDGRRTAYFTVHMNSNSTDVAVLAIKNMLYAEPVQKGYGFLFSRELALMKKHYNLLLLAFVASIIGILFLLTIITENFVKSLLITSIIPLSISLPLLLKFFCGNALEMGDVLGMVLVSGLSVNNAIYITESKKATILFRVREKTQSILVTTLTSVAGAVPLALTGSSGFSVSLANFMLWGIACSAFASLVLYPAILCKIDSFNNFFKKKE